MYMHSIYNKILHYNMYTTEFRLIVLNVRQRARINRDS